MWRVLFILTVLTASCEPYSKKHKITPNRNQRIIKVQGPPHYNSFYGHQKPIRKRPFGAHHGDEYIRPNHPPPIPPFFNGPSTNHIKHLPRPPPHVFHKSPSYGLGFPYKTISSYRPSLSKDHFRVQSISTLPIRASASTSSSSSTSNSVSSSTSYHSPSFSSSSSSSSSSFSSSHIPHIISSDDNNGPIREIPAPNLAPKPHDGTFGTISVVADVGGVSGIGASGYGGVGIHGLGEINGVGVGGVGLHPVGGGIHGVSAVGIHPVGGVHGVGGIHAVHGVSASGDGDDSGSVAVGGVSHIESDALLHTVGKNPGAVSIDTLVKGQGLDVNTYIKESSDVSHGKGHKVEIANFDEGSSLDVTNLIKDAAGSSDHHEHHDHHDHHEHHQHHEHHSGYEVTEHNLPSNDQIIKGHDGSKLYYAPDPDPSLPVHKVPPTNDPHSTPSNGQNIHSVYVPQISHGVPYIQGGSVGGHLSSQELFHLMHGYPAVIPQPVVAFVQPQIVSGQNYYQHSQAGPDIGQYLQQPEIHNLLHNSDSHHEHDSIGGSHSSVVSQSVYSPQSQYKSSKNSGIDGNSGNFPTSEIKHNYQYEPEASETNHRHSLTVIRQTDEGNLNSETVKELLLEDSAANVLNHRVQDTTPESITTVLQLKNIPEVPFYATLPSKKAAEALASLQAAGSVASNYMNKVKITRGDQPVENEQDRRGKLEDVGQTDEVQLGGQRTIVEVQQSLPLYETSITSKNLVENNVDDNVRREIEDNDADYPSQEQDENDDIENFDFKEDVSNEAFGKRIRPK